MIGKLTKCMLSYHKLQNKMTVNSSITDLKASTDSEEVRPKKISCVALFLTQSFCRRKEIYFLFFSRTDYQKWPK